MRAFRTRAHCQGRGYCGYLQMTTEAGNYARYMLDQPDRRRSNSRTRRTARRGTGLARLSAALLELVPGLSAAGRAAFREGDGDATGPGRRATPTASEDPAASAPATSNCCG